MKIKLFAFIAALATVPAWASAAEPVTWGKWTYVQGDKSVQYRVAKTGMEGDVALLRYQLRVEPGNTVSCYSDRCEGHIAHIPVFDPVARDIVATHHLLFPKGFQGTYELPETVHFPIRQTQTGRRFLDPATGLPMYEVFDNPGVLKVTEVLQACVDDKLSGSSDTRCTDFDSAKMQRVGS